MAGTPKASATLPSASAMRGKGRLWWLWNFFLRLRRVAAHADDLEVFGLEVLEGVAQRAGLRRATGRVGFGIKENQNRSLRVGVGESKLRAVLVVCRDPRSGRPDLQGFDFADQSEKTHSEKKRQQPCVNAWPDSKRPPRCWQTARPDPQ